jgi:hypothetical protein
MQSFAGYLEGKSSESLVQQDIWRGSSILFACVDRRVGNTLGGRFCGFVKSFLFEHEKLQWKFARETPEEEHIVKTTLFAVALVITLSLSAMAAQPKPSPVLATAKGVSSIKTQEHKITHATKPQAPASCSPCLFYGGDLNPSDPNADGFSDENTLLILGGSQTYGAVSIPSGPNASVTGILFNILATAAFDPYTATYDIRQGISEVTGGTDVSTGSATIAVASTGRNAFGLYEYTITATIPSVTLAPGEYWFNLEPQCLSTLDGSCTVFRQYASNTTQETNAVNGSWQPSGEMYFNSSYFGYTYANWCDSDLGLTSEQCAWMSFGLVGDLQ